MPAALHTEKTIFLEAAEIASPDERAAFLKRACGDDSQLRAAVEALLLAHQRSQAALDATAAPLAEHLGSTIGPYKLLQLLGEGGMGVVYMAEQSEPIQRRVALKVIKPGMDSRQVLARFEAERQALALMDHANIARVLDAGATPAGRPYFVMELVHGVPITRFCDDSRLTLRQRLELFVPVCQAIQHAHQKGIIHRDIKPSNVLVTLNDGQPVPKVIDFGVAKATEQKLTERTLFTQYGTMVGTLEYMSPEQAEMSALGVDTRSDIYSLGVLLYELLTGSTPLSSKRMKEVAYGEILRLIKEEEPPRPSTRLSDSGESLASISAQRQLEPAKLTKLVRGELDWIVMKPLEKDRSRRYETASGFAADVRRYLDDEAVEACPPSAGYRFRKLVRRNKGLVLAAGLVFLTLLAGVIGTTIGLVRAAEARRAEMDQRLHAEASFQDSLGAVDQFLTRLAQTRLKDEPRAERLRKELLEDALSFYKRFLEAPTSNRQLQFEAAAVTCRVAEICRALGEQQQALEGFQQAVVLLEQFVGAFPQDEKAQRELARSHRGLARCRAFAGEHADAEAAYRQAEEIQQALAASPDAAWECHDDLANTRNELAMFYLKAERIREAEIALQKSFESLDLLALAKGDDPDYQSALGGRLNNLALLKVRAGNLAAAGELLEKALACQRAALKIDPRNLEFRGFYRNQLENLAMIRGQLGHEDEAAAALRDVARLSEELAADFPSLPAYRFDLGGTYHNLALALGKAGQIDEARQAFDNSHRLYAQLVAQYPEVSDYRLHFGRSQSALGHVLWAGGEFAEAERAFRGSWEVLDALAKETPDPVHEHEMAVVCLDLGLLLQAGQREPEAIDFFQSALPPAERAATEDPLVGGHWQTAAHAYFRNGQWHAAVTALEKAREQGEGGGAGLFIAAMAHYQLGDPGEAQYWYGQGSAWMQEHAVEAPTLRAQAEAATLLEIDDAAAP